MAKKKEGKITRYTYDEFLEPRTPETGHTRLIPSDEEYVVVDMDPAQDPELHWAGKKRKKSIPVLPLQRNEIVSESRIARIVERAKEAAAATEPAQEDQLGLFANLERELRDSERDKRVQFYTHDEGWKNKLICGDSLQVMQSLLQYEGLRGKVQMVYFDPPYGIKYDGNFQQRITTTVNDGKDKADDVVAIRAFRDTWLNGVHSYLSYIQENLYLARQLLRDDGSILVQIGDENVHRLRAVMDEVFGAENFYTSLAVRKTTGFTDKRISNVYDTLLWYAKDVEQVKYRQLYEAKAIGSEGSGVYSKVELPNGERRNLSKEELKDAGSLPADWRVFCLSDLSSQGAASEEQPFEFEGKTYFPSANSHWKTTTEGLTRLAAAKRLAVSGKSIRYVRYYDDLPVSPLNNMWLDTGTGSFTDPKLYTVQTGSKIARRCIFFSTDPGDIVLDLTCGSGTTAYAAESTGRRWITCDTSRVAVNVARQRLMASVYPHYNLTGERVADGFEYDFVQRVTLRSVAYDLEPERIYLHDRPKQDRSCVRVTGPFEVMSLGRYSVEDWSGYTVGGEPGEGELENYIHVIARLYREHASVQGATGLLHAIAESNDETIGISVGPISGRVTAKQVSEAVEDALASGLTEVHVLGWAFEPNVGEIKSKLESRGKVTVELQMIRPDTLVEGLKNVDPGELFSPLGQPVIEVSTEAGKTTVRLNGIAIFDRKKRTTRYNESGNGYVAAWYLDEDYDGDCFVDCQSFFDFKKAPNLKPVVSGKIAASEFKLVFESEPFPLRKYRRIAVKVVDVYGNESTVVRDLA